jgi:hypothetical protein
VVSYERILLQPDTNPWQRGVHEENSGIDSSLEALNSNPPPIHGASSLMDRIGRTWFRGFFIVSRRVFQMPEKHKNKTEEFIRYCPEIVSATNPGTPQTASSQAAGANPRRTPLIGREALLGNKRAIYGWKLAKFC